MTMGFVEEQRKDNGVKNESFSLTIKGEDTDSFHSSRCSTDNESDVVTCRVCQCSESDTRGEAALGFLDIIPPPTVTRKTGGEQHCNSNEVVYRDEGGGKETGVIEFVSPKGEIFICHTDIEKGSNTHEDTLIDLGCSCKNDLSLAHYACALKWFITHGSTDCEICGSVAKNVRPADFKKVLASLSDYETLIERTGAGEPTLTQVQTNLDVDPDAVAAIRRQRLSEISLWFNPRTSSPSTVIERDIDPVSIDPVRGALPVEHPATKWAVEGTGILVATGLLTVTLAWLIAPRVGKKTAKNGLHILLGGICALTVVIFLRFIGRMCNYERWELDGRSLENNNRENNNHVRSIGVLVVWWSSNFEQRNLKLGKRINKADVFFLSVEEVVLTRIRYGPARYWAILFVFWFLVFGIWASRTHSAHST
ncbi:hypothetical protein GIB67_036199 [Kingdonia uniflora]|uniref:RING-CH-type domain-containing protein n=1 Tax=Kingdonia uniflora TaxID=39325 RepID=A0A7J7L4R8_9MAGN|nr:hypothetical protein GIB67_036199 [Kingdonia uniflora]